MPQRFKQLQKAGVIPRFPPMELDLDICREAYIEHLRMEKGGAAAQQLQAEQARGPAQPRAGEGEGRQRQAEKLDLELARLRGQLVDANEIRTALTAQDVVVKDRLFSVPTAVADRAAEAAAADGAQGIARVFDAAIRAALEALAAAQVVPAKVQ